MAQDRVFLVVIDKIQILVDALRRLGYAEVYLHRVTQNLAGKRAYLRRHGSGEHQRLALGRQERHDFLDVVEESHVQHLVSLIEYQMLEMAEVDVALSHVRYKSSGRSHDYVAAVAQGTFLLRIHNAVAAAVDGYRADGNVIGQSLYLLVYLYGKFACRHENERVGVVGGFARKLIEHRQKERRRLACSGLGASYQVASGQRRRYRLFLNRRSLIKPHIIQSLENILIETHVFKFHNF